MQKNAKRFYVFFAVILIVMVLGFLLLFQRINSLETALKTTQEETSSPVALQVTSPSTTTAFGATSGNSASGTATSVPPTTGSPTSVTSNILFTATSSPDLQPQTTLTVLINKVSETVDGNVAVTVKVFTDSASSYSAVDIGNLIQIFNLSSNQTSTSVVGAFKAMPPQSSVDGILNFAVDPTTTSIILQVGSPDNPAFYQFDFTNGTYKQVTVG